MQMGDIDKACRELQISLEFAEKGLNNPDHDIAKLIGLVGLWDDVSEGLDGIASLDTHPTPLDIIQGLRRATSIESQLVAFVFCLAGTAAYSASQQMAEAYNRRKILETTVLPAFQKASQLKPDYIAAQERLAKIKAMLVEGNAVDHYNKGVAYFQQQNWPKAIQEYKIALQINPDFIEAQENLALSHFNLAGLLLEQGQQDNAIREITLAAELGFKPAQELLKHF
jgi:tetratricopeptide (TPR) repeat protein